VPDIVDPLFAFEDESMAILIEPEAFGFSDINIKGAGIPSDEYRYP
jgi:hypothetical protein